MNALQYIEKYRDCPRSFFIFHCMDNFNREPTVIGKCFWAVVLEHL